MGIAARTPVTAVIHFVASIMWPVCDFGHFGSSREPLSLMHRKTAPSQNAPVREAKDEDMTQEFANHPAPPAGEP